MNNVFGNLTTQGLEESSDRLGGFAPLETDIYTGIVKALFAGESQGGAMSLTLIADFGGKEFSETVYVTNKKKENFFVNKNDPKKRVPLPGFTIADDICLITSGKPLAEQVPEEKVVNLYDFDAKKELPKAVQMLMECVGQPIALGIVKQTVNKREKQGDEYVPTTETRDENVIEKVFHPEFKLTVAEARNGKGSDEANKFYDAWLKKNKGVTRDKTTVKDGQGGSSAPPKAGSKTAPAANAAPRKSLFSK
jgi:hypothetical protein